MLLHAFGANHEPLQTFSRHLCEWDYASLFRTELAWSVEHLPNPAFTTPAVVGLAAFGARFPKAFEVYHGSATAFSYISALK
jgi:hypothetical protein